MKYPKVIKTPEEVRIEFICIQLLSLKRILFPQFIAFQSLYFIIFITFVTFVAEVFEKKADTPYTFSMFAKAKVNGFLLLWWQW